MVTAVRTGADVVRVDPTDAGFPTAPDQAAVVAHDGPALRVTAPAGSGKTRTMVEWAVDRAHRLDAAGDRSVLAVSFTVRATGELQARIAGALRRAGLPVELVRVTTFHGFAAGVISEWGHHLGLPASPRLIGRADQLALVESALDDAVFDVMPATWLPTPVANIAELAVRLADQGVTVADAVAWHRERLADYDAHQTVVDAYRTKALRDRCETARQIAAERLDLLGPVATVGALKWAGSLAEYADQLAWAVRLLDVGEVAAELRRRHPFVVVDEYQDTNVAQRNMLQRLHRPGSQLVVVGDDAQAIYRFRGATLDNFHRFAEHFPGAADMALERVYRHGADIVGVAEAVNPDASAWRPRRTDPRGGPSAVRVLEFPDAAAEAGWVASHVAALVAGGVPCTEIAVLAAQRRFLLPIARRLEADGLPVEAPGLGGLFDSPVFHEVRAVLQVAADPGNAVAVARLLRGPRYRLGPHDLVGYVEVAAALAGRERAREGLDWREDVEIRLVDGLLRGDPAANPAAAERVGRFLADAGHWMRLARTLPLGELVEVAVEDIGLAGALETSPDPGAARARSELAAVVDLAREYEAVTRRPAVEGFLDALDGMLDAEEFVEVAPPDPLSPAVRLLTIHSAKGLEFRHVVVAGVVKEVLPNLTRSGWENSRSGRAVVPDSLRDDTPRRSPPLWDTHALGQHEDDLKAETEDEQRRLFYVAATRAAETLAITRAVWNWNAQFGPRQRASPSPFFEAIEAAGFPVERPDGPAPDDCPLERLLLFETPEAAPPSPLEQAVAEGPAAIDAFAATAGMDSAALDRIRAVAAELVAREASAGPGPPAPPQEHTVTDLVLAARCPLAYSRRRVLGLPQPASAASRRGSLVHRWIEERAWALQEGADPDAVPRPWAPPPLFREPAGGIEGEPRSRFSVEPDAGAEAPVDDPPAPIGTDADADGCADRFAASPWGRRAPVAVELPVVLTTGGQYVRGTIDAVYEGADGSWEVLDVKTGPAPSDDAGWLQLEAYALAVADSGRDLSHCTLTFLSLHGRKAKATSRPAPTRDEIVARLRDALARTSGPYDCPGCAHCSGRP